MIVQIVLPPSWIHKFNTKLVGLLTETGKTDDVCSSVLRSCVGSQCIFAATPLKGIEGGNKWSAVFGNDKFLPGWREIPIIYVSWRTFAPENLRNVSPGLMVLDREISCARKIHLSHFHRLSLYFQREM